MTYEELCRVWDVVIPMKSQSEAQENAERMLASGIAALASARQDSDGNWYTCYDRK